MLGTRSAAPGKAPAAPDVQTPSLMASSIPVHDRQIPGATRAALSGPATDAERLQLALSAGGLGWWELNVETGEVVWSPEVERLHGANPGEFGNSLESFAATIHPADRARVLAEIEGGVRERRPRHAMRYRFLCRHRDGTVTTRWMEGEARLFLDDAGEPRRFVGVARDATERIEAEHATEFLVEASTALLSTLDVDAALATLATLAVPRLADWCAVDLVGADGRTLRRVGVHHTDPSKLDLARRLAERYPPSFDDEHGVGRVVRTAEPEMVTDVSDDLLAEATVDAEHLALVRALGLRSFIVVPLVKRGRMLGALTLVHAESGRRFDERALRVATELAQRVARAIDNARLFEETRREVERRTRAEAELRIANEQLQEQAVELEMTNAQLQENTVELETQTQQLQEQQVELEAQTQQLQEQQVELEMTNAHLQENAVELEAQAEELMQRTRDLERETEAARQARRAAEEANAAKSQFLAAMSHELRTPLNAVTGYTDLLTMGIRGEITPEQREDLGRIKRSGEHLLRLINDILQFAKLEAGQLEFRPTDVPLAAALAELETLVAPQVRARGLTYEFEPCAGKGEPLVVRADRDKLQQIVINLLSNAIKATEPGGMIGLACAAAEPTAGGGRWVTIRVRDSGVGIPREKLETIFDPFVQIDRKLNRPSDGVGLGLAISRDLARGMGGDLTVESEVGVGSTFTLTLPRA